VCRRFVPAVNRNDRVWVRGDAAPIAVARLSQCFDTRLLVWEGLQRDTRLRGDPTGAHMTDDERTVRELDHAWNEVYIRNDRGPFEELLASDFQGVLPDGRIISKADLMRPTEGRPVEFGEFGIDVFDGFAATRGHIRIRHPDGPAEQRFVRLYARRSDRWQAVRVYVFPAGAA